MIDSKKGTFTVDGEGYTWSGIEEAAERYYDSLANLAYETKCNAVAVVVDHAQPLTVVAAGDGAVLVDVDVLLDELVVGDIVGNVMLIQSTLCTNVNFTEEQVIGRSIAPTPMLLSGRAICPTATARAPSRPTPFVPLTAARLLTCPLAA